MRILQLAFKATIEGGEVVLLNLVRGLRARGHEVDVSAPADGPLLDRCREAGAGTHCIPLRHVWDVASVRQLSALMTEKRYAVVQSHGRIMNILARRAAARCPEPPPCIATEHNPLRLARGGHAPGWRNRLKSRIYRFLDNRSARDAAAVVCVSEAVREDKREQGIPPGKLRVIENGIDLAPFAPPPEAVLRALNAEFGLPAGAPLVGTVARLDRQKNVGLLLRAMPTVWAGHPEARLLVAGRGVEMDELRGLAESLDGSRRVIFAGYRTDVPALLHRMDVFCLPSRWEGFGLVAAEAMACRRPVVCTPVPAVCSVIENERSGLVVPFERPEAMGRAVAGLLHDPDRRARMGEAGRARVEERFTAERMVARAEALYRELHPAPGSVESSSS